MTAPTGRRGGDAALALGLAAALAALVVVAVAIGVGDRPYVALGTPDPGALARIGAPVLRLVSEVAGMLTAGNLLYAVALTRPEFDGTLTAQGYAARRAAAGWAVAWSLATLVLVPFDAADVSGLSLADALPPRHLGVLIEAQQSTKAWLVVAVLALAVAAGTRVAVIRWAPTVGLLLLALAGLLPPIAAGHSASDAGHDLATGAIAVHVLAAGVWVGLLGALLRPFVRRASAARQEQVLRRYRRVAAGCWLVLAASGIVDGLVLVPPAQLLDTGYGLTLLVKAVLVGGLGLIGLAWRGPAGQIGWRLAAGEMVLLGATVGLSVALTHLAPPNLAAGASYDETLIGYGLSGPPTLVRLLVDWRVDTVYGPLAVGLALAYLLATWRLRRQGQSWPMGRTAAFLAGCALLLVATCSGIGRYAPAQFSLHMTSHMLVAMAVPLLWALGGPGSLVRAARPPAGPDELPGPREWLAWLARGPVVRSLTHPLVALGLYALSPFLLYFTGLFDAAARFHWADLLTDAWFLAVGYLFTWPIVGVDPAPRRLPAVARLGLLVAAMPFDTVFAAVLLTTHRIVGNGPGSFTMYSAIGLPWVHSLRADQHAAGAVALGVGEAVLFAAIAVLLVQWSRLPDDEAEAALLAEVRSARARPLG